MTVMMADKDDGEGDNKRGGDGVLVDEADDDTYNHDDDDDGDNDGVTAVTCGCGDGGGIGRCISG